MELLRTLFVLVPLGKKFPCPDCYHPTNAPSRTGSGLFDKFNSFMAHMKKMHAEPPLCVVCRDCGAQFRDRRAATPHLKSAHGVAGDDPNLELTVSAWSLEALQAAPAAPAPDAQATHPARAPDGLPPAVPQAPSPNAVFPDAFRRTPGAPPASQPTTPVPPPPPPVEAAIAATPVQCPRPLSAASIGATLRRAGRSARRTPPALRRPIRRILPLPLSPPPIVAAPPLKTSPPGNSIGAREVAEAPPQGSPALASASAAVPDGEEMAMLYSAGPQPRQVVPFSRDEHLPPASQFCSPVVVSAGSSPSQTIGSLLRRSTQGYRTPPGLHSASPPFPPALCV